MVLRAPEGLPKAKPDTSTSEAQNNNLESVDFASFVKITSIRRRLKQAMARRDDPEAGCRRIHGPFPHEGVKA